MFNKGTLLLDFINARESIQGNEKESSAKLVFEVLISLSYYLKLVSTIFYQIFIFHQMVALQKL